MAEGATANTRETLVVASEVRCVLQRVSRIETEHWDDGVGRVADGWPRVRKIPRAQP